MTYHRSIPTYWDKYHHNTPTNPFVRWFHLDVMVRSYQNLLSHAHFATPPSILELGCGTGYVTRELSKIFNSPSVTLVDFNEGMLNIAKSTFANSPVPSKFIQSDFFKLNHRQKYNLVHSGGVIEHFDPLRQQQLVNLHRQLLLPGGYCIIYVPTPSISYKIIRKISEISGLWKYTDEVPMTKDELVKVVEKAGLKVIATNYFWRHYYLTEVGVLAQKV